MPDPFETFVAGADPARQEAIRTLDAIIRRAAPGLEPKLWGKLLGYGTYHYRYASGREGDFFPIGLGNQKGHLGLYLCVADDGGYLAEQHAHRLGKVSCGKSCIRIKRLDQVDLAVVEELVARAAELHHEGRHAQ